MEVKIPSDSGTTQMQSRHIPTNVLIRIGTYTSKNTCHHRHHVSTRTNCQNHDTQAGKSYDVRFNGLKCREPQNQFDIIWRKVTLNRAGYHSKRHPVKHYI